MLPAHGVEPLVRTCRKPESESRTARRIADPPDAVGRPSSPARPGAGWVEAVIAAQVYPWNL